MVLLVLVKVIWSAAASIQVLFISSVAVTVFGTKGEKWRVRLKVLAHVPAMHDLLTPFMIAIVMKEGQPPQKQLQLSLP